MTKLVTDLETDPVPFTVIPLQREHSSGDFRALAELEATLSLANDNEHAALLIDLNGTTGLSCGLISVLLRGSTQSTQNGGSLALCGPTSMQMNVLEIMRLDTLWSVYHSCEHAIAAVSRQPPHEAVGCAD